QELHAAEAVDGQPDHVLDGRASGHIDVERKRLAANVVDLFGGLLDAFLVDIGAYDVGFLARENERRGATDAACGAGDDDRLSGKIIGSLWHENSHLF